MIASLVRTALQQRLVVVVLAACAPPGAATPTTAPRPVPVVTTGPTAFAIGPGATDTWSGWLPDGRTFSAFDTTEQPISRLDPALLKAVQNAVTAAAADDVTIVITSGWRSRGFQERLFDDGIRQRRVPVLRHDGIRREPQDRPPELQ